MELLPLEIQKVLPALYSQESVKDPLAVIKYFTPDSSWTWYIIEGGQEEGDWVFFSKVVNHICLEGELGYVILSQLQEIRGALGLAVERDLYWTPRPISQCK